MKNSFYIFVIFISIIILFTVFTNSIKHNLFSGSFYTIRLVNTILPQGWGFFTKNPRDPNIYLYKLHKGKIEKVIYTNCHYKNYFGLSKKGRMIAFENTIILKQIEKAVYEKISKIDEPHIVYKVNCNNLSYIYPGEYMIIREEIAPYLWRNFKKKENTFIHVRCYR